MVEWQTVRVQLFALNDRRRLGCRALCSRSGVGLLALGLAMLPFTACQLVLGDIPPKPTPGEAADSEPAAVSDAGESFDPPAAGGSATADANAAGGGGGWEASHAGNASDASEAPVDVQLRDTGLEGKDRITEGPDSGDTSDAACSNARFWYLDEDHDEYGQNERAVYGCAPPAGGNYALVAGDCNDQDDRVHPGQTRYFGIPHTPAGGEPSFDFDCSGFEQGDPSQARFESCGLLALALCDGTGYGAGPRAGFGIDRVCGSTTLLTCRAALGILVCEQSAITIADNPYRCR